MTSERQAREKIDAPLATGWIVTNTASICIHAPCRAAIRKPSLWKAHSIRRTRHHRWLVMIKKNLRGQSPKEKTLRLRRLKIPPV